MVRQTNRQTFRDIWTGKWTDIEKAKHKISRGTEAQIYRQTDKQLAIKADGRKGSWSDI
jgi:hypothetical protein